MNKTTSINIAGFFFHIDENAYILLKVYLENLSQHLKNTRGKEDIIYDVESRIAELLLERINKKRQVVSSSDIEEVIKIIGKPEEYDLDEEQENLKKPPSNNNKKKLYRDINEKYVSGVCSGLGHYLATSPLVIRILFILLFLFTGGGVVLIYILMWILVPEAVTTSQKLDMKGEPVNLDNIERKIKEEFDYISNKVKNADYDKVKKDARSTMQSVFGVLEKTVKFTFKALGKVFGMILLLVSGSIIISLFVVLVKGGISQMDFVQYNSANWWWLSDVYNFSTFLSFIFLSLVFVIVIMPFIFIFWEALRIIAGTLQPISKSASFLLGMIWVVSILGIVGILTVVL